MSRYAGLSQVSMLGFAPGHARPPTPEGPSRNIAAHDFNDVGFGHTELIVNRLEGRAIFPSHFNDSADICRG